MNAPPRLRAHAFTWLALMALLAATFALAHVSLGGFNTVASLAIAAAKVGLVAVFFMHLRRGPALFVVFALAAFLALAILIGLGGADYATRDVSPAPWVAPL
jgi:cytochrome c oxidase subunit 4